ncbi:sodium bile acid symporter family protein [Aspergillus nomiae NRRL 13137]|uniref:Sodium bile acid symporter family protein n=1 Tax=Aspergillus nomiae NRRL (strain ATCC 15546 / NRRL 13137 / CBS 260.88 / M93) TaxID=1509407 RepID=A0A0L1IQZ1_ASPN3|nr:sodium bile acid symporter family protein [Aspergillus nomiae NRRL 13137]KNG81613.1 sodium bile acid symporter family protein [Aspergillus nomiae NRRL 13137]
MPAEETLWRKILEIALGQWFLFGIGIVILIASQAPAPTKDQDLIETVISYLCVTIIFLITGCTLSTRALIENYSRWKVHLFVQIQCFLFTSASVYAVVSLCATNPSFMDEALLIGLLLMGCVPTTISSNVVMTRNAHGNDALTVVESTIGNFLGPFLTPLLIQMYCLPNPWYTDFLSSEQGNYAAIYKRIFKQIGLSVFVPMFIGQILQHLFPKAVRKVFTTWKLSKLSSVCLLLVVWQAYDAAFSSEVFTSVKSSNIIFVVFISIAMFLVWLTVSVSVSALWLSREDTVAVAYCVPAKTPAMGVPLANLIFTGLDVSQKAKIQLPMVIFQGLQIAFGSLLVPVFRGWLVRKVYPDHGGECGSLEEEERSREAAKSECDGQGK